ncbi:MAG TPA: ParA family protein [Mesotoga sp.]|nr:ParA family protein [Mesotoga sp.]
MKTLALHLQKGGVGKTSLSGALAFELAKKGRTILLDLDPQGNASSWMLAESPEYELAAVLFGKVEVGTAIVPTPTPNLDILPTFGLDGELKLFGENQLASEPFILCDLVEELDRLGYDYAVMDLSPGMGRLERSALIAADEVITPMTPEAFSLDGIEIFTAELAKTKKAMRRGPAHRRIIINAFDGRIEQHKTIMAQAQKLQGFELYTVPVDPCFRKAQAAQTPVQSLAKGKAAKAETLAELHKIGEAVCR